MTRPLTFGLTTSKATVLSRLLFDDFFYFFSILALSDLLQFENAEGATAVRENLHNVRWPDINPKLLRVTFSDQETVRFLFYMFSASGKVLTFCVFEPY